MMEGDERDAIVMRPLPAYISQRCAQIEQSRPLIPINAGPFPFPLVGGMEKGRGDERTCATVPIK